MVGRLKIDYYKNGTFFSNRNSNEPRACVAHRVDIRKYTGTIVNIYFFFRKILQSHAALLKWKFSFSACGQRGSKYAYFQAIILFDLRP